MPPPTRTLAGLAALGGASLYSPDSEAVVKLPGGNWLTGSIEGALRGLRRQGQPQYAIRAARDADPEYVLSKADASLNSFIDRQLADYVRNRMASPKDELRLMADAWPEKQSALMRVQQDKIDKARAKLEKLRAQRPGDPLPRSVAELNALEGGLSAIKARQGLHFEPRQDTAMRREALATANREKGGFDPFGESGFSENFPAMRWETLSDAAFNSHTAGEHAAPLSPSEVRRGFRSTLESDPWIAKLPPDARVYSLRNDSGYNLTEELGLDHLTDELYNALTDPNLPEHLRINPEDLGKYSMQQAAERVADINAYRAVKKAETDKIRANNAAVKALREYPEGYRWVEFSRPEAQLSPEEVEKFGIYGDQYMKDKAGARASKTLQDALDYEADVMQHCVRGYCDRVTGGQSRILSLRDAEGRPHVTVEVNPQTINPNTWFEQNMYEADVARPFKEQYPYPPSRHSKTDFLNIREFTLAHPRYKVETAALPPRINQIKGPRNLRPNDEVLQYVQDLVRNPEGLSPAGRWADDVGDFKNTGLYHRDNYGPENWANDLGLGAEQLTRLRPQYDRFAKELPEYTTREEWLDAMRRFVAGME